jgi:hypothetical protein
MSRSTSPLVGKAWRDGRALSGVSSALKHAAAKLDDTQYESDTASEGEGGARLWRYNVVDEDRPMSKGDHDQPKSKGRVRVSQPATSGGSVLSADAASRPTTGSGSGLASGTPSGAKTLSRPGTSGIVVVGSRPNTNSGLGIARADMTSFGLVGLSGSRPGTSGGHGLGSRPGTSGGLGQLGVGLLDLSRPTTVGSVPKTPGGNVIMNPQGVQNIPTFKSPAVTPSQSRCISNCCLRACLTEGVRLSCLQSGNRSRFPHIRIGVAVVSRADRKAEAP